MISVLIPVFNRNVVELVTAVRQQIKAVKERVELVVMDDASDNAVIKMQNRAGFRADAVIRYIELPVNAGRNIIRHKLAAAANFDTLIFLDADSSFPDSLWLQRYIDAFCSDTIIMGGRLYRKTVPANPTLHFHYGQKREQRPAIYRNRHRYQSFLACNFLISKQQLSQLITDDHLHGYCHEDTFMGLQFEKLQTTVKHIDNPVFHEGIDDDDTFIAKQEEALDNLLYLYSAYQGSYDFSAIKLIRFYKKISAAFPGRLLLNQLSAHNRSLRAKALHSHRLLWLDLWKLAVWHDLTRQ